MASRHGGTPTQISGGAPTLSVSADNYFAAREFRSVDDLNEQARAWCLEIAHERRVPDARELTVEAAFEEEKSKMIALPSDDFPVEERVSVHVGKTPYVRFDKNDYSVPHTHVRRDLVVVATDERVRVLDPDDLVGKPLADHPRSFDRDQRVEQPEHLLALIDRKRHANQSRGFSRLFSVVPSSRAMMEKIAERGGNLGASTSGLLQLLDRVGAELLERAVVEVVGHDQPHLRAVHHVLDRLRHEAGLPPSLSVPVTTDERVAVHVRPHALATYDQLHAPSTTDPSTNDGGPNDDPF
jgi:hypothetical protein